eukprot:6194920-Pleurochrysis_carterae.AAC.1
MQIRTAESKSLSTRYAHNHGRKPHSDGQAAEYPTHTRPEPVAVLAATVGKAIPLDVAARNKLFSVATGRVLNLKVLIANVLALPAKVVSQA